MKARILTVAAGLFVVGCASDKTPAPNADANHPANPRAAEAPMAAKSDTMPSSHAVHDAGSSGMAGMPGMMMGHDHPTTAPSTTQAAGYTCPMHPQVASAMPGDCPICHMTLVPKKAGAAHDHDHSKGAAQ